MIDIKKSLGLSPARDANSGRERGCFILGDNNRPDRPGIGDDPGRSSGVLTCRAFFMLGNKKSLEA